MSECWNLKGQMHKRHRKIPPALSKGIWIEHKGKCKVNLCS
ncbi:MAG: hypothetical protein Q7T80_17815 [Methanoregula sp.]|nr:hypothetical protein [Methanoregula sp.]